MTTIQVRVDDAVKLAADSLFNSLGLDTSTAVEMFITTAINERSIPFEIKKEAINKGWSEDYIEKVMKFGSTPDPTFCEQPELPPSNREELFI
ncbi:MAG: type II toxin-antitoxin system RelB/DinJ family antitoxin [Lachnospiraceae bacterium]|jgi:addiction module RelB/DinJ family antitoxin|nr:type II toxin-antitoxin system RelB/DinJ family antitoxin [Lachnospiraceae bacterium]